MQSRPQGQEMRFYDQILESWQTHAVKEIDMTVWCSRSIISLLAEDRKRSAKDETNWNKILTNSLILILALGNTKDINPCGGKDFLALPKKQKRLYLQDIAAHFHAAI